MSDLSRFISAHEEDYDRALSEIKSGFKRSHWMWYIFPQIQGLGVSETSKFYAIKSLEEANDFLNDEVLGSHLREISSELLKLELKNPTYVFGEVDSHKLNSCMTLFNYISNDIVFECVLDEYFDGRKDEATLEICNSMESCKNKKNRIN